MKKGILNRFEDFETHHKILTFVLIILATILFVRLAVLVYDPVPIIHGFEIHHFDYGFILLLITTLWLLFDRSHYKTCFVLCGIAVGLLVDDFWYIRSQIGRVQDVKGDFSFYTSTIPVVVLLVVFIVLAILLIRHFAKRKK